jgi:hypothetical protein
MGTIIFERWKGEPMPWGFNLKVQSTDQSETRVYEHNDVEGISGGY